MSSRRPLVSMNTVVTEMDLDPEEAPLSRGDRLRAREQRACQHCSARITSKHHFSSYMYHVLCRSCFYRLSR